MKMKKMMMLAAMAATLVSCGGGGGRPNFGDNEYPVATVGTSSADMQTTYPATIKGVQDVEIRPKVQGFLTQINVKEGQHVVSGQTLFVLDNETYQAQVRQAQAAVNTAQQQVNTAKLTYENAQQLHANKVIGDYEMQTSHNSFESAKAQLAQAQASLASAKEMLSFCYVKSPATGVVGTLPLKRGALVSASNVLTTVSNISSMEVYFSVTEKDAMTISQNGGLESLPAVKLKLADGTVYAHEGKVTKMSGVIDQATGSVQLIAAFPNTEKKLKSGGAGVVIIPRQNNNAIIIPQNCVSEVQNKKFVYLLGEGNKVKYSEIKVDPQNDGNNYVVTEGLKTGDKYVTNGVTKLSDGMEIVPITPERYKQKIQEQASEMSAGDIVKAVKK
ncbi:membrane fusion protein, multidrug efflux system [Prevotella sp. tc2-28]|jgi:membrane fusion protein (multidrug efflux system)|uniref:efflux RND transporter periplasmic adaptor subunit n=1 Tax=Prevotella sp. tc2-28 TaxID=1761888 RepID=UPI00089B5433|nr:efflux RND transporter periplasmic adaptor subunit [Prevotella sp. tc2-28]SDZ95340.1 membrane fusion protein, multidrug efflux system [Prevotella sp. tc2-28]